jgi:Uma2 family endonuclease
MAKANAIEDLVVIGDYLAAENDGTWRHEFVNGMIYAMAGASERHNVIKLNVAGLLNAMVPETCRVFDGDMKLHIHQDADERYYYPDTFVSCSPANDEQYGRNDAVLVIEVLSETTQRVDRYEKFEAYKKVPSLAEYVLIEQEFPRVEVFRRKQGWTREVFHSGAVVQFDSINQVLTFEQIYRRVAFVSKSAPW